MTLLEMIVASGVSLVVFAVGYGLYTRVTRLDEVEARREAMTLTVQNVMSRVKQDVRAAQSAACSRGSVTLATGHETITYRTLTDRSGVERLRSDRRAVYRGLTAEFEASGTGVNVTLRSLAVVHRRPIRIEITSFIRPRNG